MDACDPSLVSGAAMKAHLGLTALSYRSDSEAYVGLTASVHRSYRGPRAQFSFSVLSPLVSIFLHNRKRL
jgi:hypothetical protein